MKIRKAEKKDLKIVDEIFRGEYGKPPYNEKWDARISFAKIKGYFNNNFFFILEENKKIIGFAIGHIVLWDRGKVGYIDEIVVLEKFQGKGYGKLLMNHLEKQFRLKGVVNIDLMTNPKAKAFKIYKKMGYNQLKDFIYMVKKLK